MEALSALRLELVVRPRTEADDIEDILSWREECQTHPENFSIFLDPEGRFRMTPLYDVLTAQPRLDSRHVDRKKFKLAMSVGLKRH